MKKNLLEKDIQRLILDYFTVKDIVHTVSNADRVWGAKGGIRQSKVSKGWPDISGVLPVKVGDMLVGLSFYCECKTATGSIREEQRETLTRLSKAGAVCVVARNVEDVSWIIKYKHKVWEQSDVDIVNEILDLNLNHRKTKAVRERIQNLMKSTQNTHNS